jgi:hypothetical protein
MSGEFVAKAIGMGVFLDDYEGDNGVSSLIETSRFRGKGCLSLLPPTFINGSGTCFLPGIGSCNVEFEGAMQMSSVSGVGRAEGTLECDFGTAILVYELGVNKI